MKNLLLFLVVGILVLSGLGAVANNDIKCSSSFSDELDQYQDVMTENAVVPVGQIPIPDNPINVQVAQSFIPTKEIITRVEVFIGKNSTATYPYILSIRDNLTKEDLTMTSVDPEDIPTEDYGWVEFDFDDLRVNIGQTYYIVSITENTTENFYAWGANNISESYPLGCAWFSVDDGDSWGNESSSSCPNNIEEWVYQGSQPILEDVVTWDMCFKTYGGENNAPLPPDISGPTKGTADISYDYTFVSEDPDGDKIYYKINWGDGNVVEWIGPFDSEDPQTVSHKWEQQGDYIISAKAKDIYDLESSWSSFHITMPRNKVASNNFILRLLEQLYNTFPILRQFLRL